MFGRDSQYNYNSSSNNNNNNSYSNNNNSYSNNSYGNNNNSYGYSNNSGSNNQIRLGSFRVAEYDSQKLFGPMASLQHWKQWVPISRVMREQAMHLSPVQLRAQDYYLMRTKNITQQKVRRAVESALNKKNLNEKMFLSDSCSSLSPLLSFYEVPLNVDIICKLMNNGLTKYGNTNNINPYGNYTTNSNNGYNSNNNTGNNMFNNNSSSNTNTSNPFNSSNNSGNNMFMNNNNTSGSGGGYNTRNNPFSSNNNNNTSSNNPFNNNNNSSGGGGGNPFSRNTGTSGNGSGNNMFNNNNTNTNTNSTYGNNSTNNNRNIFTNNNNNNNNSNNSSSNSSSHSPFNYPNNSSTNPFYRNNNSSNTSNNNNPFNNNNSSSNNNNNSNNNPLNNDINRNPFSTNNNSSNNNNPFNNNNNNNNSGGNRNLFSNNNNSSSSSNNLFNNNNSNSNNNNNSSNGSGGNLSSNDLMFYMMQSMQQMQYMFMNQHNNNNNPYAPYTPYTPYTPSSLPYSNTTNIQLPNTISDKIQKRYEQWLSDPFENQEHKKSKRKNQQNTLYIVMKDANNQYNGSGGSVAGSRIISNGSFIRGGYGVRDGGDHDGGWESGLGLVGTASFRSNMHDTRSGYGSRMNANSIYLDNNQRVSPSGHGSSGQEQRMGSRTTGSLIKQTNSSYQLDYKANNNTYKSNGYQNRKDYIKQQQDNSYVNKFNTSSKKSKIYSNNTNSSNNIVYKYIIECIWVEDLKRNQKSYQTQQIIGELELQTTVSSIELSDLILIDIYRNVKDNFTVRPNSQITINIPNMIHKYQFEVMGTLLHRKINVRKGYDYVYTDLNGWTVTNLGVVNKYGKIQWPGPMDIYGVDFETDVLINKNNAEIKGALDQKDIRVTFDTLPPLVQAELPDEKKAKDMMERYMRKVGEKTKDTITLIFLDLKNKQYSFKVQKVDEGNQVNEIRSDLKKK